MSLRASIIIPAYNAAGFIKRCLDALRLQTIDNSKFEIIVVDDGSTDNTALIVESFKTIKLLKQQNQGPATARNMGVKKASSEIVIFLDADCEPTPDWLSEMLESFESEAYIVAVKGAYRTKQTSLISKFVQAEFEYKYEKLSKHKYINFVDSYSAAFRKNIFLKMGGFDISFTTACAEDAYLSFKIANQGHKMIFNPNAIVFHIHPSTLFDYLKRKFTYISWRPKTIKEFPKHSLNDSYAPVSFKIQILLSSLVLIFFFISLIDRNLISLLLAVCIAFLFSVFPFFIKSLRRSVRIALISIPVLFLRGLVQMYGLIFGFTRLFLTRTK